MSAILLTASPQSVEELFNIEGQACMVSMSDPFHWNRRHRSDDSIRKVFILDPRSQSLLHASVEHVNHDRAIPECRQVRSRLEDGFHHVKSHTDILTGMPRLKVACFLPESLQVIRVNFC